MSASAFTLRAPAQDQFVANAHFLARHLSDQNVEEEDAARWVKMTHPEIMQFTLYTHICQVRNSNSVGSFPMGTVFLNDDVLFEYFYGIRKMWKQQGVPQSKLGLACEKFTLSIRSLDRRHSERPPQYFRRYVLAKLSRRACSVMVEERCFESVRSWYVCCKLIGARQRLGRACWQDHVIYQLV